MNMLRKMLSIEKDQSHVVILVLGLLNPYKTSIIHPPAKEKNRENEPLATSKAPIRSNRKGMKFLTIMNPNMYCQSAQQNKVH